jgi:hypothetical protein
MFKLVSFKVLPPKRTIMRLIEYAITFAVEGGNFITTGLMSVYTVPLMKYWTVYTKASKRVYRFTHCFCPTLGSFSPLFTYFRACRRNYSCLDTSGVVKGLWPYDCIQVSRMLRKCNCDSLADIALSLVMLPVGGVSDFEFKLFPLCPSRESQDFVRS